MAVNIWLGSRINCQFQAWEKRQSLGSTVYITVHFYMHINDTAPGAKWCKAQRTAQTAVLHTVCVCAVH